ncbi:MAG TPA: hypothetical protein VGM88_04560 [Kofleriaceae bacterium]|jgi:transposase-like protein
MKVKRVRGGKAIQRRCPACKQETTMHEVEITTSAGVFFIDVLKSTDRAFQCDACDETFDLKDEKPARDMAAELLAEREERALEAKAKSKSIDDELAAMKRKLGK